MARLISPGRGTTRACNWPMKANHSSHQPRHGRGHLHLGLRLCASERCAGQQVDKAYDFLSAVNDDPEVAKYLVNDWGYGQANAKAMSAVDPEVLKAKGYADVEKFVDKTLFQSPVPADLKTKMIAEFEKIKSGY
jgi:hypothetical protein